MGQPLEQDIAIGGRVRAVRIARGVSQQRLGEQLGISFQQIQKYEKGTNRIGGSRMMEIAAALDTPVAAFFGTEGEGSDLAGVFACGQADATFLRSYVALDPGTRAVARRLIGSLRPGDGDTKRVEGA